ncbi:MAG: DUF2165 family protein [Myxococcota bacterium]
MGREAGSRTGSGAIWETARLSASLLVLMVASYYLVVAFSNVTNPTNPQGSNWPFVQGVLSGEGLPEGHGFEWRFVDAVWLQGLGYVLIILAETLTGSLLAFAGYRGIREYRDPVRWSRAQRETYLGGTLGLALFLLGFIVIGGNWFLMYLNARFNALTPASQNTLVTLGMLIFVTLVLIGSEVSDARRNEGGRID